MSTNTMLLKLVILSACSAFFIPAIKRGDRYTVASNDYTKQSKYRDLVHRNNWPVNHSSRPRGLGQEAWNQHLLRLYEVECPGITAVWVPSVLWETFLAWQIIENFPKDADPRQPFELDHAVYKNWYDKGTALQLIHEIINIYGSFLGIKHNEQSRDASNQILTVIENHFLELIGAEQTFYNDLSFYKQKVIKLLGMMKTKAAEMIPTAERRTYTGVLYHREPDMKLLFLLEAFQDDFDRLDAKEETLCGYVTQMEHNALLSDEYLIFRMTNGVKLYSENNEVVKALDWTWNYSGPEVLATDHDNLDIRHNTFHYSGQPEESIEEKRFGPQSYGYSLIAGGFLETFMPKGACCLAYAGYRNGDDRPSHGALYALRVGHDDIEQVASFLMLPKIPLQLGFFGHGEFFHPRLTTAVEPELYHSLGITNDDAVVRETQLHDLVNFFIAHNSIIIQIDHRLVLNSDDDAAQKLITAQCTLANIESIRKEHIDLQQKARQTYFAFDMWNRDDLHPVLRERINGICQRYSILTDVLYKMIDRLDEGESLEDICSDDMQICEHTNFIMNRKTWVKQILCFDEEYSVFDEYYKMASQLGIDPKVADPILVHLIKSNWRGTQAQRLKPLEDLDWWSDEEDDREPLTPPKLRSVTELRMLYRNCQKLGVELNDYTFTIHQFG